MDFLNYIYLITIFGILLFMFPKIYKLINWIAESEKKYQKRVDIIENKIQSIGGEIVKIEQTKKAECPYNSEFEDDGSVYVCYRVIYLLDGETKETWSIFNIRSNLIIF